MNQLIDIIARWDTITQFIFLLVVLGGGAKLLIELSKQFVILFRGYSPVAEEDKEDES